MNIFIKIYLNKYKLHQKKLLASEKVLLNQIIPKYEYRLQSDCIKLLDANGFKDASEKEELANFLSQQNICLDSELQLNSKEEKAQFYRAIRCYLENKPGYSVAETIHPISINPEEITLKTYEDVIKSLQTVKPIATEDDALELLENYELEHFIEPEQFEKLISALLEQNIWLSTLEDVHSQKVNQTIFANFINSYLNNHRESPVIKQENFDDFFNSPGPLFAEYLLKEKKARSCETLMFTELRAKLLLLHTELLSSDSCFEELSDYLTSSHLSIQHFAHLATPREIQIFNQLVINFLRLKQASPILSVRGLQNRFLSDHDKRNEVERAVEEKITSLEAKYCNITTPFILDDLIEAYNLIEAAKKSPEANPIQSTLAIATEVDLKEMARSVEAKTKGVITSLNSLAFSFFHS